METRARRGLEPTHWKRCRNLREYVQGKGRHGGSGHAEDALLSRRSGPLRLGQRQEPMLAVEPGDTVVYHTREVSDGQIGQTPAVDALSDLDWDGPARSPAPSR